MLRVLLLVTAARENRAGTLSTFDTAAVTKVELGVQLHEDLLELACMVQREVWVDTDILWDTMFKVSLDPLI